MKSLVTFNPFRIDCMRPYEMLNDAITRFEVANKTLDKLREKGRLSGKQVDNIVADLIDERTFTIRPFLDALESHGYIRTEILPEEYIKISMKRPEIGTVFPTHDSNCVIFVPCCYNPRPYLVYNPVMSKSPDPKYTRVQGDRMVQVLRKYYYWVG